MIILRESIHVWSEGGVFGEVPADRLLEGGYTVVSGVTTIPSVSADKIASLSNDKGRPVYIVVERPLAERLLFSGGSS